MPGASDWGFIGPTYQSENPSVDPERLINLYPEYIESGRGGSDSKLAYYQTPGTSLFASGLASPVRALWGGNNRLFAVGGGNLYELNVTSGAILATYTIGSASGPAQIVFIPSGPGLSGPTSGALLVWDGSGPGSGSSANQNVWYVDGTTGTPPAVISGAAVGMIDGYGVVLRPGGSFPSDPIPINTIDGTQFNLSQEFLGNVWDPLQFAIKTGAPDQLVQIFTPGSFGGGGPEELWLMGKRTIEVWYDTGGSTLDPFPFQRVPGAFINQGVWAPASVVNCNNQICFLGGDDRGVGVCWAMNGYTPQRFSNHAIEQIIQGYAVAGSDQIAAIAHSQQMNGHIFYVLTLPALNGLPSRTLVADFSCLDASGRPMWHERGLGSSIGSLAQWFPYHAWSAGQHFLAGDGTGNVYLQSTALYKDNGNARLRARISPQLTQNKQWLRHSQFWLDIGGPFGSVTSRSYLLDWSNDGGNTYGTQFTLNPQQNTTSGISRVLMNNLGRSRGRNYRVQTTDNAPDCWIDGYVTIA